MAETLSAELLEAARVLIARGAREVYVFGSAVKGRMRESSDIDLAVSGLPPKVFYKAASDAMDVLGRPIDLVDLDDESPLIRYLKTHGELVRVA